MVGINKEKEMNATQNIGYIEPKTEKLVVTIAMTLKRCLIRMCSFFAKKTPSKLLSGVNKTKIIHASAEPGQPPSKQILNHIHKLFGILKTLILPRILAKKLTT